MVFAPVALVRACPATIVSDYARLLDLVGWTPEPGRPIVLVPTIDRGIPFPGRDTPPWQVDGVAQALIRHRHRALSFQLSRRDPDDLHGFGAICRRLGIPRASGPAPDTGAANLVLLAPVRRSPSGSAGGVLGLLGGRGARGVLAVLDGAMIGNGPPGWATHPEVGNLLIASCDPVAVDAIAATLLGINPLSDLPDLRGAYQKGLGLADPRLIPLVGDTTLAELRWPARSDLPWWQHVLSGGRRRHERALYTSWLYETNWGRLFAAYQRDAAQVGG